MKTSSPLDAVKIASPCSAEWDQMIGDDRSRYCGQCKLNVYSFSGMSGSEVEEFLLAAEGRVCVRLFERADGTMITENCPVGLAAVRLRVRRYATAAASVIVSFLLGSGISRLVNGAPPEIPAIESRAPQKALEKEKGGGTKISFGGMISNLDEVKQAILRDHRS